MISLRKILIFLIVSIFIFPQSLLASEYYWRNGTSKGSGYYWRNGSGVSFPDDVMLGVCIALEKDEQPDICEIYPFIEDIK